jgi:hypothetical protein
MCKESYQSEVDLFCNSFERLLVEAKIENSDFIHIKWVSSHLVEYLNRLDGFCNIGIAWDSLRYSQLFAATEVATKNFVRSVDVESTIRDAVWKAFCDLSNVSDSSEQASGSMESLRELVLKYV